MAQGGMPEGVKTAMYWAIGVGVIALTLLILLIIFGNLTGNVGFGQDSTPFINETITLTNTGATPATAQGRINGNLTNIIVVNATGGELVTTANFTHVGGTGVLLSNTTGLWGGIAVNVSATVVYDSNGLVNTNEVIGNYTLSATNLSSQFPTVGTIVGIALLLIILIGLLAFAVRRMMGISVGSGGSYGGDKSGNYDKGGFG